ncbi:MAG: toll/interleukin-1 receptor domain-containing protein [Thalassotalea sp.]
MSRKVFISYSHKDEAFREELEEHLTMLGRKSIISVWHDRKITTGEEWKKKIDNNLEAADIIILLVSSSFLASDYCYDIEMKRALQKESEGSATIVSIILRNCDWADCEFSKFQAVPKDAVPITLWADRDTAWLDAVRGLKDHISKFSPSGAIVEGTTNSELPADLVTITDSTLHWLDDTEVVLTHRKVNNVILSDIFVVPDIEVPDESKKDNIKIVSSNNLFRKPNFYLVSGEEQQGKTSLLKRGYRDLLRADYLPIYLDGKNINKSNVEDVIKREIKNQYTGLCAEDYILADNRVLLIDNIDEIVLNQKHRNIFLSNANEIFDWVIITCHSSFAYVSAEFTSLNSYQDVTLLGFGNVKREEMCKKWVSLGVEESIEESDLYSQSDELKVQLDTVIKKNIVPAKPIYVLMLLQMFEAYAKQNIDMTSHGHCYQQLIYQSFEKAGISGKEYELYLNVLTELAWAIFTQEKGLNSHYLDVFFKDYGKKYLSVNSSDVLEKLIDNAILQEKGVFTDFKYPYIYYFFVGKKIAESYSLSKDVESKVQNLFDNLHREDYANILIFITHHTKDLWLIRKIETVLAELFREQEQASLTKKQLSFMQDFIKLIPKLIMEQREIQKERHDHNTRLDEIERNNDDEFGEANDLLAKINKTFKGVEIAGQIIRNRHATMTRDELYLLADSGISAGLRFLNYFIKLSDTAKNEIIKIISLQLLEHPNLPNTDIESNAQGAYLQLTYGVINALVKKISSAIGSSEAAEIYQALEEQTQTPAHTLIKQSIELQFKRRVDIKSIEKTVAKLYDNPVCVRIIKEMVVQHVYMFPVEYKIKQQLAELLDISVQGQRILDKQAKGKG